MKTNYRPRSRHRGSQENAKRALLIAVLFVLCAGVFTIFRGTILHLFSPVWRGENTISRGTANTFGWISTKDTLLKENSALREKIVSQEAELVSLRGVEERERELLELLGRPGVSESSILGTVLARPPETAYDILVVDAGSESGVQVGAEVVMPEGALLGIVEEVEEQVSKVRLHTSSGKRTSAILERHNIPVILSGQGGGNFRITLPRDVEVVVGDRILSAEVGAELLGVVGRVNMSPTDAFKEVLASGPANLFNLRFVLINP